MDFLYDYDEHRKLKELFTNQSLWNRVPEAVVRSGVDGGDRFLLECDIHVRVVVRTWALNSSLIPRKPDSLPRL